MSGLLPIVEQLAECETHKERADWLVQCPDGIICRDHSVIRLILRQVGMLVGVDYLDVRFAATTATRLPSGELPQASRSFLYRAYVELQRATGAGLTECRRVVLESPYAGEVEANVDYARACVRDSLTRGEAPIASHLLYTQPGILDDMNPEERIMGIEAGLAWAWVSDFTAVYTDRGISKGMQYGIDRAKSLGRTVEFRTLPGFGGEA